MGKLFNLKEWLTVADAARHLSIIFGEDVTEADVLRLGLDERLRLSIYFVNQAKARSGKVVGYDDTEWKEIPDITAMSQGFQKIHKRMQENKPIEERGKTLRIMKSLEIGGGRYFNLDGKEIHIYGVWDLIMAGQGQSDVEQKCQTLIGGPDVTDQALYGAFIEGPDGQTCELLDNDNKMLFCLPGGGLPESGMLVVRTEELRAFEASINGAHARADKPLSTTERNTLLTIIGVMAKKGYAADLSTPFVCAKEIQRDADGMGIKISDDTIAAKLKQSAIILEEKTE